MTQDQVMALLRQLLPVIGALAAALGWIAPDRVGSLVANILATAGPVMIAASSVWTLVANTKASILKSAAQMPEVTSITLDKALPETAALDSATPNNVVTK